ncbi:MAG: hypothetical protein Q9163_001815 [Psora crenata]
MPTNTRYRRSAIVMSARQFTNAQALALSSMWTRFFTRYTASTPSLKTPVSRMANCSLNATAEAERLSSTRKTLRSEADIISQARSLLHDNGALDNSYLHSFDGFIEKLQKLIAELNALLNLLGSIIEYSTSQTCSIMHQETSNALREASTKSLAADVMLDSNPIRSKQASTSNHLRERTPPGDLACVAPHVHGKSRPSQAQSRRDEPIFIDLTEDTPPPRDAMTPAMATAAKEAAAATPYWKTHLNDRGHNPADLTVYAHDVPVYVDAKRLTHRALQQAENVVEVCERYKAEAEVTGLLWQAWMEEVERREEGIERKMLCRCRRDSDDAAAAATDRDDGLEDVEMGVRRMG